MTVLGSSCFGSNMELDPATLLQGDQTHLLDRKNFYYSDFQHFP